MSPPDEISVATRTHGRVLLDGSADADRLLVAFHGYGESAEDILNEVRQIPGAAEWRLVSIQALNRFYTRGDQKIVANWMTRQDREQAIADNIEYVDRVVDVVSSRKPTAERTALSPGEESESASAAAGARGGGAPRASRTALSPGEESESASAAAGARGGGAPRASRKNDASSLIDPLRAPSLKPRAVFIGFSQGVAMAYRAATSGRHRATGVIALGGDIPPELKDHYERPWCPVLIGAGATDPWYTAAKVDADAAFLQSAGVQHDVVRFAGGHEWTDAFRQAAGDWLAGLGR